jgi:hypothetical protein
VLHSAARAWSGPPACLPACLSSLPLTPYPPTRLPCPPALQTVTQGTFNPLWHQVHHFMATLRLARSGTVSAPLLSCAAVSPCLPAVLGLAWPVLNAPCL